LGLKKLNVAGFSKEIGRTVFVQASVWTAVGFRKFKKYFWQSLQNTSKMDLVSDKSYMACYLKVTFYWSLSY
jgi:hypothetical protein